MDWWAVLAIFVPAVLGFVVGRSWIVWGVCVVGVATIAVLAAAVAGDPDQRAGEGGPGLVVLFFGTTLAVAVAGLVLGVAIRRLADHSAAARRRDELQTRR